MGGSWMTSMTLVYAAQSARALYPEASRLGVQTREPKRLPVVRRSAGFFYPRVHRSVDDAEARLRRRAALPMRTPREGELTRDFLYHRFRPGEKLRESVWLGGLDDCEGIEVVFSFGASQASDLSDPTGEGLIVRVGDWRRSLRSLGAWPPREPDEGGNAACVAVLPREVLAPDAVNWIELEQRTRTLLYVPCVPACMEPYVAPLWSETEDRHNPPLPV